MTTLGVIALTVLGTILIFILIIGCIGTRISIEEMDSNRVEKLLDDTVHTIENPKFVSDWSKVTPKEQIELTSREIKLEHVQEGRQYVNDLFKKLNSNDTEPIESYLENLSEYKKIIDDSPDKFLDFHFQNSIRDEQYELSQYISDVAKKRGMILKAELN